MTTAIPITMFMDKHPAVAIVLALATVTITALGYATVRYICDTIVKFGRGRQPKEKGENLIPVARVAGSSKESRSPHYDANVPQLRLMQAYRVAMKDLGYTKAEYQPVLDAMPGLPLEGMISHTITALAKPSLVS